MKLLVITHSRSGGTQALADAAAEAAVAVAEDPSIDNVEVIEASPTDLGADDVRSAAGVLVATPEHFGAMAGLIKDFFERIYYDVLDETRGLPYGLIVKGAHDGEGTVRGVTSIATGLGWRAAFPPLVVIGDVGEDDLAAAAELGGSLAAGLATGIL